MLGEKVVPARSGFDDLRFAAKSFLQGSAGTDGTRFRGRLDGRLFFAAEAEEKLIEVMDNAVWGGHGRASEKIFSRLRKNGV